MKLKIKLTPEISEKFKMHAQDLNFSTEALATLILCWFAQKSEDEKINLDLDHIRNALPSV